MTVDGHAVSYGQWGVDFVFGAISQERVLGVVNTIAGQGIDFGPIAAGPGGIAKVRAYGRIGESQATRLPGELVSFRLLLPVSLTFEIDLQIEKQRFDAELLVPLTLTAVALDGVRLFIDATPPHGDEVQVKLKAQGLRASVLQRLAGVEAEVRRFVARYVIDELEKPHVRNIRLIDVSAVMDAAWASMARERRTRERADGGVAADLNAALEREILEHADALVSEPSEDPETGDAATSPASDRDHPSSGSNDGRKRANHPRIAEGPDPGSRL
jgi:hypothetical protein